MSDLGRVLVLAGGLTHERDVSLRSGRRLTDALKTGGLEVLLADADAALLPLLAQEAPAAVFIALHGGAGEDGAIRGVLDCAGVPYVGASAAACRLAFDKPVAKELLRRHGAATPDWVAVPHATFRELGAAAVLERITGRLGLPLMVKPAQGGSALGARAVLDAGQLPAAMVNCFSYGPVALVEQFVLGTEIAVSVIDTGDGPRPLPAVEISAPHGEYDYAARYTAGVTDFFVPARLPGPVLAQAGELAVSAHNVLGLRDISRTDAVVDAAGRVQFLEVNVAPGLTETSLLPMAVQAAGLELGDVCRGLLEQAARR